ncbi:hypothetical protein [Amycolatopsis sp. FDAARGOS 1241]|uniref:hypothetical protein n=1 Tax=Amycolatopsis sp. FDAARGOS 1241 TaxID=2778070 RepID=UPI00194F6071|nr:hypothetical protein [Amycolatopsis sp. FDAARGOS 1241]QRP46411.1 hypothetical protein I6J71_46680 [Amycolatopsis sp. FDAARGOS 1241]
MLRKTVLSLAAFGAIAGAIFGGAGTALASTGASGILDSGVNFSEPDGSQGIGGDEGQCIVVTLPETGSLQQFDGTMTLWTGADCKTGDAAVLTDSVADIPATFGAQFAHVQSIYIGDNAPAKPPVAGASAILDSGINFSEPDGSQGIGGNVGDIVDVNIPASGSIQFVSGTLTLYTGPGATGDHLVVTNDVKDLAALGFGHVQSIVIGAAA